MNQSFHQTVAALLLCGIAQGADITTLGSWTETITAANLVAGAGSDLQSSYESTSGTTTVSVHGPPGNWTVLARRGAGSWHSNVTLYIKRTSDGVGTGTISGGEAYVELTGSDTAIFTCTNQRISVAMQYKLTGVSCDITPSTYSAPIIFTVQ